MVPCGRYADGNMHPGLVQHQHPAHHRFPVWWTGDGVDLEARPAPSEAFSLFRTRIATYHPSRVGTGPLISYQDDHMLVLSLAGLGGVHG